MIPRLQDKWPKARSFIDWKSGIALFGFEGVVMSGSATVLSTCILHARGPVVDSNLTSHVLGLKVINRHR